MKNYDILNLVNAGTLAITANELGAEHAYKIHKFKKALRNAFDAIADSEKELLKEAGIEDGAAFDKERKELRDSKDNLERLAELDKQFERFSELRANLYNEDAKLESIKTMPFEAFHELQKENKGLDNKPLNFFEELLEGVLWAEPDDGDKKEKE